jgi:NMD protein affecting ribosome stability and mRNA decay
MFGHCADCGDPMEDFAALMCDKCVEKPENQTLEAFARQNGHRARIMDMAVKGKL